MLALLLLAPGWLAPGPAWPAPLTGVEALALVSGRSCAIVTSGDVMCWGRVPQVLPGLSGVTQVALGEYHGCALLSAEGVKCWGENGFGQLGDGTRASRTSPVDVSGLTGGVSAVEAGSVSTCALTTSGAALCWGSNSRGQIGDGTLVDRLVPTMVTGLTSGVTAIGAGVEHACALTADGGVKCWGRNESGQLGDGTTIDRNGPTSVIGLDGGVVAISIGSSYSCALLAAGTVKCWGLTFLAGNFDNYVTATTPAEIAGLANVVGIAAGGAHACALIADGTIKCWGFNGNGQLGDGSFANSPTAVDVVGLGGSAVSVAASGSHTCAALSSGEARCWGLNLWGQLGSGDISPSKTRPVVVGDYLENRINFGEYNGLPTRVLGDPPVQLSASVTSGLPITFTSLTPAVCSVAGTVVTLVASGVCSIEATQGGDAQYGSAYPELRHFRILDVHTPRLVNISTRAPVFRGNSSLIAGFVIGGSTTKRVAIVANGPSLGTSGITNYVANPRITLVRAADQSIVKTNSTWRHLYFNTADVGPDLNAMFPDAAEILAIGLNPFYDWEPALIADLAPGAYTAIVSSDGDVVGSSPTNFGGVGLAGVYELDHPENPLVNISTRAEVLQGDNVMIAGFVIQGDGPRTVAIVATGPSLAQYGIASPLADPTITLVRQSDHAVLEVNDNWQASPNASQLQAAGFAPSDPAEAGILATLAPGAYTAIVSGVGGGTGVAVVGVYKVN